MKLPFFLFLFFFPLLTASNLAYSYQFSEGKELLVNTSWLSPQVNSIYLLVLDVRTKEEYQEGHIPHAVSLPISQTFRPSGRSDLAAPIYQLQELFSHAGIDHNIRVVIYDNGKFLDSARMFWLLETHGHPQVSILNGGFPEWEKKKLPISKEKVKRIPKYFPIQITSGKIATKLSTILAIRDPNIVIIDARSEEEFLGEKSLAQRSGHIPTAVNIPHTRIINQSEGLLKSLRELQNLYGSVIQKKSAIAYCNKGKQSALTFFALRMLNYPVSAYDGSWYEWGNDNNLPIETPVNQSEK